MGKPVVEPEAQGPQSGGGCLLLCAASENLLSRAELALGGVRGLWL